MKSLDMVKDNQVITEGLKKIARNHFNCSKFTEDDDFGLWYMDALDYPKKYAGKTIRFKGQFYHDRSMPAGAIVPGRFAMQCCANDIAFIGFISKCPSSLKSVIEAHQNRDWIEVEAELNVEFRREYKGKGPVLYIKTMKDAAPADEEVVYFT